MRLLIVTGLLVLSQPAGAEVLDKKELRERAVLMPGEQRLERTIQICLDKELKAVIEVTAKGNGTLAVGQVKLKVYDAHNDGAVYANDMAHVEFVDLNDDGCRAFQFSPPDR